MRELQHLKVVSSTLSNVPLHDKDSHKLEVYIHTNPKMVVLLYRRLFVLASNPQLPFFSGWKCFHNLALQFQDISGGTHSETVATLKKEYVVVCDMDKVDQFKDISLLLQEYPCEEIGQTYQNTLQSCVIRFTTADPLESLKYGKISGVRCVAKIMGQKLVDLVIMIDI